MPAKPFKETSHGQIARYEELLRITRVACELGITKVRITGGEPFARKGILSFLKDLSAIDTLEDISITTNGALLTPRKIKTLMRIGIKRLNFSLDTLDPDQFRTITRRDEFNTVWNNILAAHECGISPLKINAVILNGINENQIENLAELTFKYPFHVRFIEYMPMGVSEIQKQKQLLSEDIKKVIEDRFGPLESMTRLANDGPAKKFKLKNAIGLIGLITPVSSHFCSECNRLRLTSTGNIRPCLLNNFEKDILGPLRNNATDQELKEIILSTLSKKPDFHGLANRTVTDIPISHMTSIGG